MSANRIFLVCQYCPQPENALLLAERGEGHLEYEAGARKLADKWFRDHAYCGTVTNSASQMTKTVDHFKLAYNRPQDWDVSPPAQNTVAGGVKLALINGSKHE